MERLKFVNEFGEEELVAVQEFKDITNDETRLRNIANVALNHFEDHGEEHGEMVALSFIFHNIVEEEEANFRAVMTEEAKKRGMWDELAGDSDTDSSAH